MTAAIRIRRAIRGRLRLAVPLLVMAALHGGPQLAVGAEPVESPNPLDRPMADLAILDSPDDLTRPTLLVLDEASPAPSIARIAILRRDEAWTPVTSTDIDLGAADLTARWLVGLGEGRFALVATAPQSAPGTGRAVVVGLAVNAQGAAVRIDEMNRQAFDRAIEDSGAADVDGFGSAELVLGLRPHVDSNSCGTSSIVVVDGSISAVRRSIDIPGPRGAGVLGRLDAVSGADLLVYASAGCPPGGDFESSLLLIRLADGSQTRSIQDVAHAFPATFPPPLLVDVDGAAPDEVIATGEDGLAVFDPSTAWHAMPLAGSGSVPLVAGPTGEQRLPGVRVAILDATATGALVTARLTRDKAGGLVWNGRSELAGTSMDPGRWSILLSAIQAAGTHQTAANAWIDRGVDTGCPYVVLPGATLSCGTDDLRKGAAWLATRPVLAMPGPASGHRVLLVAAGLEWRPETGLPASPTPAAAGPVGWWRHGPSTPFALSEIGFDDLAFAGFPTPAATIEAETAKDGTTNLRASTGTRLLTNVIPLAEGQAGPVPSRDALVGLTSRLEPGSRTAVVRIPVPPGAESGRAPSSAPFATSDFRLATGQPTSRWAMRVVPLNDWGEWGPPVTRTITRDSVAPKVALEEPFTSPIWPFAAHLVGRSDPGSTVRVEGIGELEVDAGGGFTLQAPLAPWPQSFRVTATDPFGNVTVGEFTIVGGVDYRRFPWPAIIAVGLLSVVAARWLFGGGRGPVAGSGATRWGRGSVDEDASTPVIEELPPGGGLAQR